MEQSSQKSLVEMYHDLIKNSINDEGIFPFPALVRKSDDSISMLALAVPPQNAYQIIIQQYYNADDNSEIIYGLDRVTKPNQGTEFNDCFTGAWMVDGIWYPYVINYQIDPLLVRPYDWANDFWVGIITRELSSSGINPDKIRRRILN